MRLHRCYAVLPLLAFLLTGLGCTGGKGKAIPTTGLVVQESGGPLAYARVTFNPVNGGPIAFGVTDAQGRFSLTTADGKEGAYEGQYKVTLLVTGDVGEADKKIATDMKALMKEREKLTRLPITKIHANYGNVAKTPLKADIPASGDVKLTVNKSGA